MRLAALLLLVLGACAPRHEEHAHGEWLPDGATDSVRAAAPDSLASEAVTMPVPADPATAESLRTTPVR